MSEETKETLRQVLHTLGLIEVRGRENLDMLLGCILTLESMTKEA